MAQRIGSFLALLATVACGADGGGTPDPVRCEPPPRTFPPTAGTAELAASGLTRVMGADLAPSCVLAAKPDSAADGEVLAAVLPLLTDDGEGYLTPPRIVRVSAGGVTDVVTLGDPASTMNTGFLSRIEVAGQTGLVPRGLRLAVLAEADGTLLLGNSVTGELARLTPGGGSTRVAGGLTGVTHLLRRRDGTVLVSLPAIYDGSDVATLKTPPRILRLGPGGSTSVFFTFPVGHEYSSGLFRGLPDGSSAPIGAGIALTEAPGGDLYAVVTYDRSIFRITSDGQGAVAFSDLPFPVGVAADGAGLLYVSTTPLFDGGGELCNPGDVACHCPDPQVPMCFRLPQLLSGPRVWAIAPTGERALLYQGGDDPGYMTGFLRGSDEGDVPVDVSLDVFMDGEGNLVLQDALAGEVRIIPTR